MNMSFLKLAAFFMIAIVCKTSAQKCENKENCEECIKEFDCAWCTKANENNTEHCFVKDKMGSFCAPQDIINPTSRMTVDANDKIVTKLGEGKIVQIAPQRISLSLRRGEERTIEFQYGQSHDFPVDLYYILDLSASLKLDKDKLGATGTTLVKTMQSVTTDFAIGFGSFVDKTDAPFISTRPDRVRAPCEGCVPAYSYKNHMSLMAGGHGEEFSKQVNDSKVSGNLDVPEGGFDALMQAMVCTQEIGWRNNSRRIIVFSTDAPFHVAGDGKLAGIVIPNDGRCHLENNTDYTGGLTYDYPSVSHINYIAKKNNFHILFVVKDKVKSLYEKLGNAIEHSRVVSLDRHKEIIKEIEKFYQDISNTVEMTTNTSQNLHVTFETDCKSDQNFAKGNKCLKVVADQRITFRATIKALNCFGRERIIIRPSTQNVFLQVDVETLCECNCGRDIPNSPNCNENGDLHCGVCECHSGFNGKKCECDQSKGEDHMIETECKNGNDSDTCTGRGICLCNVCQCDKKADPTQLITGKYCECDNFDCPGKGSKLCSGNGECVCGRCQCNPDFSGERCECKNDNSTCTFENAVCSNHGTCECGRCKCDRTFYGRFCEECTTCESGKKCTELKPCVECKIHEIGPYKDDCDLKCTAYNIHAVDAIDENQDTECVFTEDSCKLLFTYKYENDKIIVAALKELQCSQPVNILALILGIVGGILFIGILLLVVWKVWVNHKDKVEYAKFEEEKARQGWGGNPLFLSPVTKYRNPVYGKDRASFLSKRRTTSSRKSTSSNN